MKGRRHRPRLSNRVLRQKDDTMIYQIGYPKNAFRDLLMANKRGASKNIRLPLENGMTSDVDLQKIDPKDGTFEFSGVSSTLGRIHGKCSETSGWIDDSPE